MRGRRCKTLIRRFKSDRRLSDKASLLLRRLKLSKTHSVVAKTVVVGSLLLLLHQSIVGWILFALLGILFIVSLIKRT